LQALQGKRSTAAPPLRGVATLGYFFLIGGLRPPNVINLSIEKKEKM
jgi:hypothetical protein